MLTWTLVRLIKRHRGVNSISMGEMLIIMSILVDALVACVGISLISNLISVYAGG